MNCLVTAGPTCEPLDEVRRLTNFSTGRLGTELANFLAGRGHAVTLLIGESATWAGERHAQRVDIFATTRDLRRRLKSLSRRKVDAIFHAAAVSDFTFGRLFARDPDGTLEPFRAARKISTRGERLLVELLPTAKIIAELRAWYPRALIVGWKYEADGRRAEAVRAARRQLAECATDACVANGPAYGNGFGLVTATGRKHFANRTRLFQALEKLC
ncbi:MAG: phosphopantothenoylcysteine decarboxylase [Verrucomicrobiota bacterium]